MLIYIISNFILVEFALWTRADASIPQIKEFLNLLMTEMTRSGKTVRGPYLAWLELYKMVHDKGQDADQLVGELLGHFSPCPNQLMFYQF